MARLAKFALSLALLWLCTAGAAAQDKIDVTGTWAVEVNLGDQKGTPEFTFKQEGEKLTGKYKGQLGDADVKGKVKGKEIEFSFEIEGTKAVYTGTIDKDTMKGKANYADQLSGTWTGKRQKAKTDKVDVTGNWAFEVDLGGQQGSPEFTFKQEGEKLTGKYKGQFGEADLTGKVKGAEIEFSFEGQGAKVVYTGTIDKDTMKGKANYADQLTGTFTAKKKK